MRICKRGFLHADAGDGLVPRDDMLLLHVVMVLAAGDRCLASATLTGISVQGLQLGEDCMAQMNDDDVELRRREI